MFKTKQHEHEGLTDLHPVLGRWFLGIAGALMTIMVLNAFIMETMFVYGKAKIEDRIKHG